MLLFRLFRRLEWSMAAERRGHIAFDNERYLAEQSEAILGRMDQVGGKLPFSY